MNQSFRNFLDTYLNIWRTCSLGELKTIISIDYQAREINEGKIVDFGYEESIEGWKQGFDFVLNNDAKWIINEKSLLPLKDDETLVIITATMEIDGSLLDRSHLFFQTFKRNSIDEWKLVRSYIEAGVTRL
ncbi:flavoprotein [Jeotgalibacillus aurantiacus]|uniref:flavoprotein n=1 Tax=Jeotgalibacillus aurantiacus TaxID=2763266 RepID=UPI001D0AF500|nr:flavoprotein [Jeotgalibacillus aurantiacus]